MKSIKLLFIAMLVTLFVVGCSNDSAQPPKEEPKQEEPAETVNIPQLNEERADAATMVLISAPPLQPADHKDRWNPELLHESCLMCHGTGAGGAREIPIDHFTDEDRTKGIFGPRSVCITCHAEQTDDTRPAFNREN